MLIKHKYWKGRIALYQILKAMNVTSGDEVILPAYTCVVVPNAIQYLVATPVYVEINPETYNLDIKRLEDSITQNTKVIICQNTYGLSTNLEEIIQIARKYNLYTIEDCTHGYGGRYNGKPNGSYCDAAFFSTQWNKPFSTGIGGFAQINNPGLIKKFEKINKSIVKPTFKQQLMLWALIRIKRYIVNDFTYWPIIKLYRFLSKHNIILGSSQGQELIEPKMPEGFLKGWSWVQEQEMQRALKRLPAINQLRKKNGEIYTDFLKQRNKKYVDKKYHHNHLFLKYPILVNNRDYFFQLAEKHNINLGDWFISPLHPIKDNFHLWHFDKAKYPISTRIASQVVNLPTDTKNPQKVLRFLDKYLNYIL